MKALTNINARSIADAVAAANAAAARGQAFAFSGGGTDLVQQIKDGTNQADVLINLRTVREARAVVVSPMETRIGGLITLTELADHTALSAPWAVLREAAASVGTPQIRNVATLAGNVTQRPWCWYYRNGFPCFKAGGNQCFSVNGENQQHAIFGGGPSFIVHPSDLAPALVALNATFEVTSPEGERRLAASRVFRPAQPEPGAGKRPRGHGTPHRRPHPDARRGRRQHLSENHRPGSLDPCRSQRSGWCCTWMARAYGLPTWCWAAWRRCRGVCPTSNSGCVVNPCPRRWPARPVPWRWSTHNHWPRMATRSP